MYNDVSQSQLPGDNFSLIFHPNPEYLKQGDQDFLKSTKAPQTLCQVQSQDSRKKGRNSGAKIKSDGPRSYNKWTLEQEEQFYYYVVDYMIKNPYFEISWESRKQNNYYSDMQKHIAKESGQIKTIPQCKIKDSNFSKANKNTSKGYDLLDNALSKVKNMVKRGQGSLDRIKRFKTLIESYADFKTTMGTKKPYELDIDNLLEFSQSIKVKMTFLTENLLSHK